MDRRLCAASARTRLGRRPQCRNRVSLGGDAFRAFARDHGRIRSAQGRCHCYVRNRKHPGGKAGDIGHPDRIRGGRRTRLASASSTVWRDRAATSPVCRTSSRTRPASESSFCARLSPVCAVWRSWPMSALPTPRLRSARLRRRPERSALRSPRPKSGERRISRPHLLRSRDAQRHFMSLANRW